MAAIDWVQASDEWQGALAAPLRAPQASWASRASPSTGPRPRWPDDGPSTGAVSSGRGRRSHKERFCATFPDVGRCRHGATCAFAHAREEVNAPLLAQQEEACVPGALTDEFFTERFKTLWCPIGAQHDWQACMYAHTYQDARRPPVLGYGHQLCPYWNKKDTSLAYSQRCPLGPRCPYSHGAKEQLYHPGYFRTLVCRDLQRRRCPRGALCAFFHRYADCRTASADGVNYTTPLPKEALRPEWVAYFLNPPRFQEVSSEMIAVPETHLPVSKPRARRARGGPAARKPEGEPDGETPRTPTTAEESGDEEWDAEDTSSSQDPMLSHVMLAGGWQYGNGSAGRHIMVPPLAAGADHWGAVADQGWYGGELQWCMVPFCAGAGPDGMQGLCVPWGQEWPGHGAPWAG